MSYIWYPKVAFVDNDAAPDLEVSYGQLRRQDGSNSVTWLVDGVVRVSWTAEEFEALCKAIEVGPK